MKRPKLSGEGPVGSDVKLHVEVVENTNGSLLHGYVRLAHHDDFTGQEVAYLGSLSVGRLLRLADTIRRRHEKWLAS